MQVVYSAAHQGHDPATEVAFGQVLAMFERPERVEEIRRALSDRPDRFGFVAPTEHGLGPIEAVHDPGLVAFLADVQARGVDLYLHQQALDTSTPSGRMLFGLLSVFSDYERAMIRSRVMAGLNRVRGQKRLGRPPMSDERVEAIKQLLMSGKGVRETARQTGAGTASVQRIKQSMAAEENRPQTIAA